MININRRSDIILNNNSHLKFKKEETPLEIVVKSRKKTVIEINKEKFSLKKGLNKIPIKSHDVKFNKVTDQIRLSGISLEKNQTTNWPWFSSFKFNYNYGDQRPFRFKINNSYVRNYDFKILSKRLTKKIKNTKDCDFSILSDVDTSIITKLACKS